MKGISLSINVIVILTIAILVMVGLFYFFNTGFGPPQGDVMLNIQQSNLCGKLVNKDLNCNTAPDATLADVCKQLGYSSCQGSSSVACAKECCRAYCGSPGGETGGGEEVHFCEELDALVSNPCSEHGGSNAACGGDLRSESQPCPSDTVDLTEIDYNTYRCVNPCVRCCLIS